MRKLSGYKRIVVKVGSALLVERGGGVRRDWLGSLAADLAALRQEGAECLVVSSGAIALGRGRLSLNGRRFKLEEAQAAAAVGQIALAKAWAEELQTREIHAAQVLLTLGDTEERRRYLNARATLTTLLGMGVVPVVNENDTVATTEIRYGDNDRLAARVAAMVGADLLVLLSDVDGLYSAPPAQDANAHLIPEVTAITPEIEAMAGDAGSELSRGGMRTKVEAAKIAVAAGAAMVIGSGHHLNPLTRIDSGAPVTWFRPQTTPATARKAWIAGHLEPKGSLSLDAGAVKALRAGRSLLPPGVSGFSGHFARGDTVLLVDPDGIEIGRGIVGYDADEAAQIIGHQSKEISEILGYVRRSAIVHHDDLVLRET
ncbi:MULTISPECIES: glutamate 5-kinase [Hyphomicrobiales]|uniref:Glutamate 5-kinase n=2 Tax=Hyphomicrobiales TaxID=356 RepID=A0A1G5MYG0_AFIMA|nr:MULTISPECIES: glutamate 5-kinase [Hyphomicrobiales]MBK1622180.1 glutamate 5-kinase [Afifella marina DSM 2698]MBK1628305.1 glutamate 5-kinase [Afifella marina]MBK5918964.1 glutamate 5-kinase [Afifella marina]MDQ0326432.1 glutamate 5-kinase [Rhodopseudomonas julia]RAI20290.1 glutamate 5-kinase [Afifella marina DSM 2698]